MMHSLRLLVVVCALICAAACGANNSPTAPTIGTGNAVNILGGAQYQGGFVYSPSSLTVSVGTTVTWTNGDSTAHTVTSDTNLFDSGSIPPNGHFSYMFPNAGTFRYHCTLHPGMTGSVTVQ
jgi:plastocyanin